MNDEHEYIMIPSFEIRIPPNRDWDSIRTSNHHDDHIDGIIAAMMAIIPSIWSS